MCIVCKDWQLGKLTVDEAWRNLNEIRSSIQDTEDLAHYFEVAEMLSEKENESNED